MNEKGISGLSYPEILKETQQRLNMKLLSESEWRMIHNALSVRQTQLSSPYIGAWATKRRLELQQLMDKIRDNYIKS